MASDKHAGPVNDGELPGEVTSVSARCGGSPLVLLLLLLRLALALRLLRLLGLWPRQLSCSLPRRLVSEPPKQWVHVAGSLPVRGALRSMSRPDEICHGDSLF